MKEERPKGILDAVDDLEAKRAARKSGKPVAEAKKETKRDLDLDDVWS
jgi:hypothetical protein